MNSQGVTEGTRQSTVWISSLGLVLAFTLGSAFAADRKQEKACDTEWVGADELEMPDGFFSARVSLTVSGKTGRLIVDSWTCATEKVENPGLCKDLVLHSRAVVRGIVSTDGTQLKFVGNKLESYDILAPAGMKPTADYCLDTFAGTVNGKQFLALHSDNCSPETRVTFQRKKSCT